MRPLLLASLLACTVLTNCKHRAVTSPPPASANTLVEGTFITSSGIWSYRRGNDGRDLTMTVAGKDVTWHYNQTTYKPSGGRSSGGSGYSKVIANKGTAPWFLYVESPERLWFFDGKDELAVLQGRNYHLNETRVLTRGKLQGEAEQVPAELFARLPAESQALLPKPTASPAVRPSL